jgi:RNA polymerase sigma-70 factor (ECF subfamily)
MRSGEELIGQYQRRVFTFAHYFLACREEAEDVTQEVLIKLWRRGGRVVEEKREAWLLRVTRNACIDRLRRRRTTRNIFDEDADEARAASPWPDPEREVQGRELSRKLVEGIKRLHESYRTAVILREIQGLTYQEMADVLGVSVSVIKVRLHRGRRRLREMLVEDERHDEVAREALSVG